MLRKALAAVIVVAVCGTASVAYASSDRGGSGDLSALRKATTKFHDLDVAGKAGYGLLLDAAGIACIDMPGMGAMGVHYAKGAIVGDGVIDPLAPEAMVYAPDEEGHLHLAAVEYVVLKADWDAKHASPPELFGQPFNFTPSGNRFGLPPYYSLHVWAFEHNPAGTFSMWNPKVSCTPSGEHEGHDDGSHH
jgi:hypothetical protein